MTENSVLELAPDELVIPLKVTLAGSVYRVRHRLRPPSAEDWFAYDDALAMAIEETDASADSAEAGYRLELRSLEAATLLWNRLARGVEGYTLSAEATWRELVPAAHKEAAIRALTLVAPTNGVEAAASTGNEFPLQAEQLPVVLEAVVAGRAYARLVHSFRPPNAADERAYRRLLAETLIVRGSRAARTLIPARMARLVRFYDELILSVDGYALNHQPLASRDEVIQSMDAWHKRVAVQALFGEASGDALAAPLGPGASAP